MESDFSEDTKWYVNNYQEWAMKPKNINVCLMEIVHVSRTRVKKRDRNDVAVLIKAQLLGHARIVWAVIKAEMIGKCDAEQQ